MKLFIFLIAFLFFTPLAYADIATFECKYRTYSDPDGNHNAQDDFQMSFIIDLEAKKSYMRGNNGSVEVKMISSGNNSFSFLEITDTGNIITTAIDSSYNSVHSRNVIIEGALIASQYYGTCKFI